MEQEKKKKKLSIVDKLQRVFTKDVLTKEELGRDGYMLLRFLSMKPEYVDTINKIQRYQGVLGHRIVILLQNLFAERDRAPFLEYIKAQEKTFKSLDEKSINILKALFHVSAKRLDEYLVNLWVTDEELAQIYGVQK